MKEGVKNFKIGFFQCSAILVNLEYFLFFPFLAKFVLNTNTERGGEVKNYKKQISSKFLNNSGNFEYFYFFPFVARFFWTPTMRRGEVQNVKK